VRKKSRTSAWRRSMSSTTKTLGRSDPAYSLPEVVAVVEVAEVAEVAEAAGAARAAHAAAAAEVAADAGAAVAAAACRGELVASARLHPFPIRLTDVSQSGPVRIRFDPAGLLVVCSDFLLFAAITMSASRMPWRRSGWPCLWTSARLRVRKLNDRNGRCALRSEVVAKVHV
jgi:hypothetical protein